jgi:hypothetical protein
MARAPARGPRDGRAFKGLPMRRILSERIGTNFDDLAWHADAGRSFAILHTASTDPVTDAINFVRAITATLLGAHLTGIDRDSLRSATSQPGSASAAKQSVSGRKAGGAPAHRSPNQPDAPIQDPAEDCGAFAEHAYPVAADLHRKLRPVTRQLRGVRA